MSALASVPKALPALAQARALQDRAERLGLKVGLGEDERIPPEIRGDQQAFGQMLFALIAQARHAGIDPEEALRKTNANFRQRFGTVESLARGHGQKVEDLSKGEQREAWDHGRG